MNNEPGLETSQDHEKTFSSWLLMMIPIVIVGGFIVMAAYSPSTALPPTPTQPPDQPVGITQSPLPDSIGSITPTQDSSCTSFDYTRWSRCATDGTQSRMVTAAYPKGCNIKDFGVIQGQEQSCTYIPIQANAQELLTMAAAQIKNASGGSMQTSYISGTTGGSVVNMSWLISDDNNLLIDQLVTDRYTGEVSEHILMRDTDRDFRPNIYSQNGTDWYQIAIQNQSTQTQLITLWAVDMDYFGSYLLDY